MLVGVDFVVVCEWVEFGGYVDVGVCVVDCLCEVFVVDVGEV